MYRVTKGAVLALLLFCVRVLLQTDVVGSLSGRRRRSVLYTVIRGTKGFVRPARGGRCGPRDNRGLGHWRRRFDLLNVVGGNEAFPSVEPTRPPVWVGLIDNINDVPSREDEILRVLDTMVNEDGKPKVKRCNTPHRSRCTPRWPSPAQPEELRYRVQEVEEEQLSSPGWNPAYSRTWM